MIRIAGRWSSDIYEIYCRTSLESALGVGKAIASTLVTRPEFGFHDESFELMPGERDELRDVWGIDEEPV